MNRLAAVARLKRCWILAGVIVVIDQASKAWAHATLNDAPRMELIPGWLNLIYSRNPGGLFGYFTGLDQPWRTMLLIVLPVLAIALVVHYLISGDDLDRISRLALALVLGGAVGNLIDRVFRGEVLFRGEVIDFIDAQASGPLGTWLIEHTGTAHWHTFNVADSCIVSGAILLLISAFWPQRKPDRGAAPTEPVES